MVHTLAHKTRKSGALSSSSLHAEVEHLGLAACQKEICHSDPGAKRRGRNLLSPESPMPMWGQPPPAVQRPSCIGPQRGCPILCGLLAKGGRPALDLPRHQQQSGCPFFARFTKGGNHGPRSEVLSTVVLPALARARMAAANLASCETACTPIGIDIPKSNIVTNATKKRRIMPPLLRLLDQ